MMRTKKAPPCPSCNAWWRDYMNENSLLVYILIVTFLFFLSTVLVPQCGGMR